MSRISIWINTPSVGGIDVSVVDVTENPLAYKTETSAKNFETLTEAIRYIEKEVRRILEERKEIRG